MARRRRRSSGISGRVYIALVAFVLVIWIISLALKHWYATLIVLAAIAGVVYLWRASQRRATGRAERVWQAEWEANRKAWRELVWEDGPYSVIVSGFTGPDDATLVFDLLSDTPSFRDTDDPEVAALELVDRIRHIAPQVVAEGISQHDAIHLKEALEGRGAKVKIREAVRVANGGARREPIPVAVRREVWRRDGGQCVDCGSRERLEYDHIIAVANGGSNTVRNIELRCEACNRKKGAKV